MDLIFSEEYQKQREAIRIEFINIRLIIQYAMAQNRSECCIPYKTSSFTIDCLKKCGFKITPTTTQPSHGIVTDFDLYEIKF